MRKCDPLALSHRIRAVISGPRQIFRNGKNRVKICCENRLDANALVVSQELKEQVYTVYIPPSLIYKKAFINGVP